MRLTIFPTLQLGLALSADCAVAKKAAELLTELQQQSQFLYHQLQLESKRDTAEQELKANLKGIRESICKMTDKMTELTLHHRDIEHNLQRKQQQRNRLLQQQDMMDDKELVAELVEEIDNGIQQLHRQMDSLEQELLHYRQQKDKQEARFEKVQRDLNTHRQALLDSKAENVKLKATVDANHKIFELMMQFMVVQKTSNDRVQEKLKVNKIIDVGIPVLMPSTFIHCF